MKTLLFFFSLAVSAQDTGWKPFTFLTGEWIGEGTGGQGTFSFQPDLDSKVLVRRNHTVMPTGVHDDLMVVSRASPTAPVRADYWDNEGHVIHYEVVIPAAGKSLQFISDNVPAEPRFRLTYTELAPGRVAILFEIAPPGKPGAFNKYLEGVARRR